MYAISVIRAEKDVLVVFVRLLVPSACFAFNTIM